MSSQIDLASEKDIEILVRRIQVLIIDTLTLKLFVCQNCSTLLSVFKAFSYSFVTDCLWKRNLEVMDVIVRAHLPHLLWMAMFQFM